MGNGINNLPASVTIQDRSGNVKAQTTYTYDVGTLANSGTLPQHVAVTGSRGNLTTVKRLAQGTTTLNRTYSYWDTGQVNQFGDINAVQLHIIIVVTLPAQVHL